MKSLFGDQFLQLGWQDFVKGLIMAILGGVFGLVQGIVNAGTFVFSWTDIWHAALVAAVAYLAKNLFTNSQDQFMKLEPKPKP